MAAKPRLVEHAAAVQTMRMSKRCSSLPTGADSTTSVKYTMVMYRDTSNTSTPRYWDTGL